MNSATHTGKCAPGNDAADIVDMAAIAVKEPRIAQRRQ